MSMPDGVLDTADFSEGAMRLLHRLALPASPPNYELAYAYATGRYPDLNVRIDGAMRANTPLGPDDVRILLDRYCVADRQSSVFDEIGERITDEISSMLRLIESSAGSAARYVESLRTARDELNASDSAAQITAVLRKLVSATTETEQANQTLRAQLAETKAEIQRLQSGLEEARQDALTDPLTQLGNRKHFDRSFDRAIERALASNEPLALILADLDHFKAFNDTYGHQYGDQVLRLFAGVVRQGIRPEDVACRYGGEEFAILLPQQSLAQAHTVAQRILFAISSKTLTKRNSGDSLGRVTLSAGVSSLQAGDSTKSMIERADAALYAAKAAGRNRVLTEHDLAVRRGAA